MNSSCFQLQAKPTVISLILLDISCSKWKEHIASLQPPQCCFHASLPRQGGSAARVLQCPGSALPAQRRLLGILEHGGGVPRAFWMMHGSA